MRLVEEFRASGEEICSNNEDDNNNGQIDLHKNCFYIVWHYPEYTEEEL